MVSNLPPAAAPVIPPSPVVSAPPALVSKMLTVLEARKYMLTLINQDRATEHLPPVELDEGAPTTAGQAHAEDMAKNGYLGHWGTDGSVPEQRHTDAGGSDLVLENALCFTDEKARTLDGHPLIEAEQILKAEAMFFNEVPPNDGHRKNILKPFHKKVGIGVAQPLSTPTETAVPCFSQEFVDSYGTYEPVPKQMRVGSTLHVAGTIAAPATVGGVGLARIVSPRPIPVAVLNTRRTYPLPKTYQMYWPAGFVTPLPVSVDGNHFAIDVPVSDAKQSGMYELSIWAKLPGQKDYSVVSLRTIKVD